MNIHTQLKMLTLLCIIPLFNAFAAQLALPESLRVEFARINALSDHEILCKVACLPQKKAEKWLAESKQQLKKSSLSHFAQKKAHCLSFAHKFWAIVHELEVCDNPYIEVELQAQKERIHSEWTVTSEKYDELEQSLCVNGKMPLEAYNYRVEQSDVYYDQASLLLAQKTKLENTFQQKEAQWQQREQALLAQLSGYQLLVDGEQIDASGVASQVENSVLSKNTRHGLAEREGMPNVPGGVEQKREHKRRGSF